MRSGPVGSHIVVCVQRGGLRHSAAGESLWLTAICVDIGQHQIMTQRFVSDSLQPLPQGHVLKVLTVVECTVADSLRIIGVDTPENGTPVERVLPDLGHRVGDDDTVQRTAVSETALRDRLQGIAEGDVRKTGTVVECPSADIADGVGNHERTEHMAVPECFESDESHSLRDGLGGTPQFETGPEAFVRQDLHRRRLPPHDLLE